MNKNLEEVSKFKFNNNMSYIMFLLDFLHTSFITKLETYLMNKS